MSTNPASDPRSVAQAYLQSTVENAPPIKIVRLMYEGALRFLDRAAAVDSTAVSGERTRWLSRADAIVNELRASLDHNHDPRVSHELDRLYLFVHERIAKTIIDEDPSLIPGARVVLATLLEGWKEIELRADGTSQA
jgi:flagellar protein FliS